MRSTYMEINTQKFINNIDNIQKYVGNKELMPVIKANGYGTYINKNIDILNRFNIVAVALVEEAIELRELGYTKEIFVLNQPDIEDIDNIIKYDITIGLSDETFLEHINKINNIIKVHLEIETGMNRTGININNLNMFINKISKNIIVEGCYTHLSSADFDKKYTKKQLCTFISAVEQLKKVYNLKYIHSSASNGLLNYDDGISNTVRPGIIMYGYESYPGVNNQIDIQPISVLKSKITFIKELNEGEAIGYSQKYITNKKTIIATIPIGYADGIRRNLSNKGHVVINNKKAPIIGNVCMDSLMVDVTDIENVNVGTEIYIFDNNIVTLDSIADICNTINYEILCTISSRIPRKYI